MDILKIVICPCVTELITTSSINERKNIPEGAIELESSVRIDPPDRTEISSPSLSLYILPARDVLDFLVPFVFTDPDPSNCFPSASTLFLSIIFLLRPRILERIDRSSSASSSEVGGDVSSFPSFNKILTEPRYASSFHSWSTTSQIPTISRGKLSNLGPGMVNLLNSRP